MTEILILATSIEIDNNSVAVGVVIVALVTILNLALTAKQLFTRTPPIESEFSTKHETHIQQEENLKNFTLVFDMIRKGDRAWREKISEVSVKLGALDERSAELKQQTTIMSQDIKDLLRRAKEAHG